MKTEEPRTAEKYFGSTGSYCFSFAAQPQATSAKSADWGVLHIHMFQILFMLEAQDFPL